MTITYRQDLTNVDWTVLKELLRADHFDNGRTPDQLQRSFAQSYAVCLAYAGETLIGTARALSDGGCNAYIIDVWTQSAYRRQGIGRTIMHSLLGQLQGQHVVLFTDDQAAFYQELGFVTTLHGMEQVIGTWLRGTQ